MISCDLSCWEFQNGQNYFGIVKSGYNYNLSGATGRKLAQFKGSLKLLKFSVVNKLYTSNHSLLMKDSYVFFSPL
jgi:hypothetical protein